MRLEGKRIVVSAAASGIGGGSVSACTSGPESFAGENPAISTHVLDVALAEGGVTI